VPHFTVRRYYKIGWGQENEAGHIANRHIGRKRTNKMIKSLCLKAFLLWRSMLKEKNFPHYQYTFSRDRISKIEMGCGRKY
jgi:hypothetical protein